MEFTLDLTRVDWAMTGRVILFGALMIGYMAALNWVGWKITKFFLMKATELDRYEFYNRSARGVVGFSSYEAANSHMWKKVFYQLAVLATLVPFGAFVIGEVGMSIALALDFVGVINVF